MKRVDTIYTSGPIEVTKTVVSAMNNNVYVITDTSTKRAVLIDAAAEPEHLLALCRAKNVERVLTTHGHPDHIGAVAAMRDADIAVAIGAEDAGSLPAYDHITHTGDVIKMDAVQLRAIATPGHTPGSISFALEGTPMLFTGDTLFPGGPGATRFPNSSFDVIMRSLDALFSEFPDATRVLPGHGDETTIGTERPHVEEWRQRRW